ncbi:hypothetical protein SCLCIDRAFT_1211743 [Scleroderma citrinum Foug A]|uniref:Uncharacterized protein n=1 Tax=Scleroderma citrinum Foug A TaxID=1036808 RepID=A0A0C3EBQ8_9AGAM|nr:hypothetical protein SCLCIDRAFT_1211743 [Scleroderma citrinum Foug A]
MLEIENTDRWRRLSAAMMMNEAVTANIMAWVAQRAAATLTQRESRQLAMESHPMRQSQRTRDRDSLESSGAPTNYAERLYRVVRRGRIKVESIKANQTRASSEATREHFKALLWTWTYKHVAVDSEPSKAIQNT